MKTPSTRVVALEERLGVLKRHLLPTLSPTGEYTEQERDQVRAFQVLAHAELEAAMEDLVTVRVHESYRSWKNHKKPSKTLLALLAYDETKQRVPGSLIKAEQKPAPTLDERLETASKSFQKRVQTANHGIKEENLLALLLPAGLVSDQLDVGWLASMTAFGNARGHTAHRSSIRATAVPDLRTVTDALSDVLEGLRRVDRLLQELEE